MNNILTTTKQLYKKAYNQGYAIGAFNTANLETTQAIIEAAHELNAPVIIATSLSTLTYAGAEAIRDIVWSQAKTTKEPIVLHLDHSPDFAHIKRCVNLQWNSVMIDGSALSYNDNINVTKKVTTFCHKKNIPVEAELGRLKGEEGWVTSKESIFTDPQQAKEFVTKTHCDSLAVSIGTSHGAYKFTKKSRLDINRLKEINAKLHIPLVLHGASHVSQTIIKKAQKYGAQLKGAQGVADNDIKRAVKNGVCKVNCDTDLRLAADAALREYLRKYPQDFDLRHILTHVKNEIKRTVKERIKVYGSGEKA